MDKENVNRARYDLPFGAGGNGGAATAYGSAVYVIDIADKGKVLKKIDVPDKVGNSVVNSVVSAVIPVTAETTTTAVYEGALVYFADFETIRRQFRVIVSVCIILSPFIGIKIGPFK